MLTMASYGAGTNSTAMLIEMVRLQAQADEMRSGRQWISVEERLPTVAERVLVFTGEVEEAIYWAERDRDGEVVRDGFCDVFENDIEVTHWMPLPASPTTSGDGQHE